MSAEVTLRSIGPSVYLPSLLFGIGQGAIAPVIALSARELGASVATAGMVVAVIGLGRIAGDLPAGTLAVRVGERRAMLLATGLALVALALCIVATTVWMLALGIACTGLATAVWGLARHAYLTEIMPFPLRARALSTLGGMHRIGLFVGPFLGAATMRFLGTDGAYWVHLVAALLAAAVLRVLPEAPSPERTLGRDRPHDSMLHIVRRHVPVLRTLGVGALILGAVRASRQVVVPLWAEHIGLDPATTSLIFGISGAVDMLLFYPAGLAMDRIGRSWIAVPSMLILGAAHLLLPLTASAGALTAVAMLMGLGNGVGSGLVMTIGSDVSPAVSRAVFLGAWRLFADVGTGVGPLTVAAVTSLTGLAPAIVTMGAVSGIGAIVMWRWIPRYGRPRQ